ncbi:MAG TPA: hypothetical protein VJY35_14905, partial [Candidatus Eisenbacteria bacterium]|nr:hypothetical protein [Candidatus Eisenbacteria bacterium]
MPRSSAASRARLLRRIEIMAVCDTLRHWSIVPPELAKRLRPRVARVGDALLTLSAASDSLRMNRVIGLDSRGLAREPMIDEIIAFYRAARVARFSLLLGPAPGAGTIAGWLARR